MARSRLSETTLEIMTGILLSLSGAATSWCGYQSSLWDGIQAADYSKATTMRLKSGLATAEAGQLRIMDGELFMEWLTAHAEDRKALEEFYHRRFRSEFRPAFEAWLASDPRNNDKAYPTPFDQPEYKQSLQQQAQQLDNDAAAMFEAGQTANTHSDNYVLNTVVFGMVMFFAGMAQQFKHYRVKEALLIVSLLLVCLGLYRLINYPIAH